MGGGSSRVNMVCSRQTLSPWWMKMMPQKRSQKVSIRSSPDLLNPLMDFCFSFHPLQPCIFLIFISASIHIYAISLSLLILL